MSIDEIQENCIKEITIFTEGDSSDAQTWSNVPYFLTNTLEQKGYTVHRVNVYGSRFFRFVYDKVICRVLRHSVMPHTTFGYERSLLYKWNVNRLMQRAVTDYPNTDCFISTSFSFAPIKFTDKPCALFCDWTYDYYFGHFLKREPDFLEVQEVKRQNALIEQVNDVFVLFPDIAKYMQHFYQNKHIHYLGNVINSDKIAGDIDFYSKHRQKKLLFIGLPKYKEGVLRLIQTMPLLREQYPDLTLSIIGMNDTDLCTKDTLPSLPFFVTCYGYLSKNIPAEKALYYSLLEQATVYVNTTPVWAGFSSALEALYHYVPIVTTPYDSFLNTFGTSISFGSYCPENTTEEICTALTPILSASAADYQKFCEQAHEAVLDFTWDSYVEKMLQHLHSHSRKL